jgi:hypothetical protein
MAVMSPSFAFSMQSRVNSSASPSKIAIAAMVERFFDPTGRPCGLPVWPLANVPS